MMQLIRHRTRVVLAFPLVAAVVVVVVVYCLVALIEPAKANHKKESQFNPQCLLDRNPSLSSLPLMRVYSPKTHKPGGEECRSDGVDFKLRAAEDWRQQRRAIKEQLLSPRDNRLYDPNLATYVLIHGFQADWLSSDWMCALKNQILNASPANVLIVDWSGGSKPLLPIDYGLAVSNTEMVADILAGFLESLFHLTASSSNNKNNNATTTTAASLHLIGHSLGAHIAGFVGYSFQGSVGEVIALDPAGPCFTRRPNMSDRLPISSGFLEPGKATRRLSRASARSVTAIHTDATMFGLNENCADTDIYVNGGQHQPGSSNALDITYSHSLAHDLLATYTSEWPDNLCFPVAYLCPSWADYEAGQCGVCLDNKDDECALLAIKLASSKSASSKQVMQPPTTTTAPPRRSNLSHTDRMYIKMPGGRNSCFFTYQVVLSFSQEVGLGQTFYLELDQKPGERRGQIFRISEGVEINSAAHKRLMAEQSYIWEKNNNNTGGKKSLPVARQFYTALLSFEAAEGCRLCDGLNKLARNKSDCIPLDGLKDARVWAEDSISQLAPLYSLTINYMSGRNHVERMKHSHMILSQGKFGHVSEMSPVYVAEAEPKVGKTTTTTEKPLDLVKAFISVVEKPIKCLTELQCNLLDPFKEFEGFKFFLRLRTKSGG